MRPGSTSASILPQFFSPVPCCILFDVSSGQLADIEQMEKIVPLITCEISLCQNVCELVLGVNVTDLDFWVQVDSVKKNSHAQLCGFWIRVSLFDFILSLSS